jgi:lysophospholipase L1-like esterase
MSWIDDIKAAFRDSETEGVPASGEHEPVKAEIRAAFDRLASAISSIANGLLRYETKALLDADTDEDDGTLAYVWGDSDPYANTVYQWNGASWEAAPWYFDAVAAVVQPLLDDMDVALAAAQAAQEAAEAAAEAMTVTDLQTFGYTDTTAAGTNVTGNFALQIGVATHNGTLTSIQAVVSAVGDGGASVIVVREGEIHSITAVTVTDTGTQTFDSGDFGTITVEAGDAIYLYTTSAGPDFYRVALSGSTAKFFEDATPSVSDSVTDTSLAGFAWRLSMVVTRLITTATRGIFPSNSVLDLSDYIEVSQRTPELLRFHRPIVEANAFQWASPGARVRFVTNSRYVHFLIRWNTLVTRSVSVTSYDEGVVLADGVEAATFVRTVEYNEEGTDLVEVDLGTREVRTIELVWPYWTGMDLLEVRVSPNADIAAPDPRPSTVIAFLGDSITHGANTTKITNSWTWLLAEEKSWQAKNYANGSRLAEDTDGAALAGSGASRATLMIGFNDWFNNRPLATYQAEVQAELAAMRTALPSAKIYAISPIYSTHDDVPTTNSNGDTLDDFRAACEAAFDAWADGNSQFIDGLSIMTNDDDRLTADGVHPNDTGAAEIATALAALIT